jgi:hypothetical protein
VGGVAAIIFRQNLLKIPLPKIVTNAKAQTIGASNGRLDPPASADDVLNRTDAGPNAVIHAGAADITLCSVTKESLWPRTPSTSLYNKG